MADLSDDDDWNAYRAELAAQDAAEEVASAARPVRTPDDRMAVYQLEVLARIRAWCIWHIDRAGARGLDDEPLFDLLDAIDRLADAIANGGGDDLPSWVVFDNDGKPQNLDGASSPFIAAFGEVAFHLGRVQEEAEMDKARRWCAARHVRVRRGTPGWREHVERAADARSQLCEVETSAMLNLRRRFRVVSELRHFAKIGELAPLDAQLWATEELAFAPGYPTVENVDG